MKYYAIHDKKAEKYFIPVVFENDAVAVRWFTSVINGEEIIIKDYPEDYTLEMIGKFDERTGIFTPDLKIIMSGTTVSRKEQ